MSDDLEHGDGFHDPFRPRLSPQLTDRTETDGEGTARSLGTQLARAYVDESVNR